MAAGFENCTKAIFDALLAFTGEPVTFTVRKTGATIALRAVRTEPIRDDQGEPGKRLASEGVVWSLYRAALGTVKPESGDTITDVAGNVFTALPMDGKLVEQRDPFGLVVKINTKKR